MMVRAASPNFTFGRKMVVWGIRPPDPPEMVETLKFQAKVFKYEIPYGLKIAPNPRLKAIL